MALVDDRPGREVVRSLFVVLAVEGKQPAPDYAAVVRVQQIRLGLNRIRLGRGVTAREHGER
jgi:hypothetical protein